MTGSTLYRRLPNGTWAAQREDEEAAAPSPASPVSSGEAGVAARPVSAASPAGGEPAGPRPTRPARSAEENLAAEVAAAMAGGGLAASAAAPGAVGQAPAQAVVPAGAGAARSASAPQGSGSPAKAPTPGPAMSPPQPGAPAMTMAAAAPKPPGRSLWARRPRPKLKKVLKWAAIAYVAWLLFLLVYCAFSLNKVDAAAPDPVADTPGTVWLMVGSDSREGLTKAERKALTTGGDVGQRTDTIMLMHMGGLGAPTLVSIPRDSWVTIPEHQNSAGGTVPAHQAKVNAAFAEGGAPLLNQTLQNATGLHIDHYAEVGFGGIVDLTDAVGGIDVCIDKAINDVKSGLKVKAGCQTLNGKDALAYVRMRYADPRGDLGRIERQQEFVSKLMGQVLSWKTVVFPWRQWWIANAALDSVAVDEQANLFNVSRLGLGLGQVAAGMGEVTTVPTSDSDHWANGQWVLRWDEAAADRLWASMGAP